MVSEFSKVEVREKNLYKRHSSGLSLVELLIAMTIGLFIVAGVISVMGKSKNQFMMEQEISYVQENIRFALDQLSYDIRMAGYYGCSVNGELTNTINGSTSASNWQYSSNGIKGFEIGDANFPTQFAADVYAGTDTVVINRGEQDDSFQVTGHTPASATIAMAAPTSIPQGSILVLAKPDCSKMAIFQMSGPANSSTSAQVNHATGVAGVSPGNCHKALTGPSGPYACDSTPSASYSGDTFPPGSSLMRFRSTAYFIKVSPRTGLPALYRQSLITSSGSATTEAQELASGVEDFEIIYGVDTDSVADGIADRYFSANQITVDKATAGSGWIGWDRVLSARVTLIARSNRQVFESNTAVDLGDGDTFNDRYLRQKATATVRVRNRGLGV